MKSFHFLTARKEYSDRAPFQLNTAYAFRSKSVLRVKTVP